MNVGRQSSVVTLNGEKPNRGSLITRLAQGQFLGVRFTIKNVGHPLVNAFAG